VSLRVLHVLDHSWPVLDGYSQRSRSIISTQAQLGMKPSVLTGALHETDDPTSSEIFLDGIRYWRTPCSKGVATRAIRGRWPFLRELAVMYLLRKRIGALLETESFDVIHAHSPALCGLAALYAARAHRIPFVYEIRCFWEDSHFDREKSLHSSTRYHLGRALETHVVRHADAIVGIARSLLNELEGRHIPSSKLFHVPNGVDNVRFVPRPRDNALASQLGVNGVPTLGFLGTLFRWEGVAWLVRAASELHRQGAPFKLLIVGDGAESPDVRRSIEENNASDFVSFVGRVPHDQVERYYSVMDVLVYPRLSIRLTELVTPLKPLEAMALGKPILGSSVGGIRELIEPDVDGVLFNPGDIEQFCKQASRLLQQPGLRSAIGEQARQKMAVEKDWKFLTRRYEAVYQAAVRNAGIRT
jgi:glycogen(starch) synthase